MIDAIRLRGSLELRLVREDGGIEVTTVENLVVTVGKQVIANRLLATPTENGPSFIAVGSNGTAPAISDIALGTEISRKTVAPGPTVSGAVLTAVTSFAPGDASGALTEAGLFSNSVANSGKLIARTTFALINKGANDTLQVTWTLTVG